MAYLAGVSVATRLKRACAALLVERFFARDGVTERISAYRMHTSDPLVFTDGGGLVWRVGEGHQPLPEQSTMSILRGVTRTQAPRVFTKCGNQYPSDSNFQSSAQRESVLAPPPPPHPRVVSAVNVSTYGWVYVW